MNSLIAILIAIQPLVTLSQFRITYEPPATPAPYECAAWDDLQATILVCEKTTTVHILLN